MKIIISHVYSFDNKGDAALLGVLIQEAARQYPGAEMTILTMDRVVEGETFEGVPVKPSFMQLINRYRSNKVRWMGYGLTMSGYSLLVAAARKKLRLRLPISQGWRKVIDLYADADLILPVGGGYLRTNERIGSVYDFMLLLHPLVLAHLLGKPTVLFSQSVGPFYRKIERLLARWVLGHAVGLVIAREDHSMKLLTSLGIRNAVRSVDAGFLLEAGVAPIDICSLANGRLVIGVTARKWLRGDKQGEYEAAMAETLDYLIKKHHAYVVFIPQVTATFHKDDDRLVSHAIYDRMQEKAHASVLDGNYGYKGIKAMYDQLDCILGTRFHSVIFSLTSYVPALAIEYEYKTGGIMHDLDLDQWVVKIENVTPKVMKPKMDELIKEKQSYIAHLDKVLPAYISRAHDAIEYVDQAYRGNLQIK
jgi:colanic acid/amylovoran biosynthesis protein